MAKKGKGGKAQFKSEPTSGVSQPETWFTSLLGGGATVSGIQVTPDRALANPTVVRCVSILSDDVAKLAPVMYEGSKRGSVRKEVTSHSAAQLFAYAPNDWMTPFDYWRFHQFNYLLDGNHYDVMMRNQRGDLEALFPIPRNRVTIYSDPVDGDLYYGVARGATHEETELRGMPLMIPSQYILHDRGPSRDSIIGMSPISWCRETIGLALAGEDHASRTFSAGARPSGVLQHPKQISPAAKARLKSDFDEMYRGQAGALKTMLLEEGLEFKPITMSNAEVQFIESRKMQVEEVGRIFGIPLHKLGTSEMRQVMDPDKAEQNYVTTTLVSHFARIESLLDARLLTSEERGKYFFEYDLTRLLRGDMKSRYESYALARQWGWYSVDDIRALENMNPAGTGGDERLRPMNMVPLGTMPELVQPGAGGPSTTAPNTQPPTGDAPATPNPKPGGTGKSNGHAGNGHAEGRP